MSRRPLTGRTVVVTRAAEQAGGLTGMLQRLGAQVVEVPLIAIVDVEGADRAALGSALADVASFDWVVVTSPNGARRVRDHIPPEGSPPHVAAIGAATEAELGRRADLVPARSIADGLLAEWPPGTGRVLLLQGDQAGDTLVTGLRERGWEVDRVVAYRNEAVAPDELLLARAAAADAITFMSGSALRSYLAGAGRDRLPPVVVSVGPATTAVAEAAGVVVTATAQEHTASGVINALIEAVRSRAPGG